jgi:hypothetical protein
MKSALRLIAALTVTAGLALASVPAAHATEPAPPQISETGLGVVQPMGGNFCTGTPGNAGSTMCMQIRGSGLKISSVGILHGAVGSMSCNNVGQFRYTLAGESSSRTYTLPAKTSSCLPYANAGITWYPAKSVTFKDGSTFCGRIKNSSTGNVYSNWACATMRK